MEGVNIFYNMSKKNIKLLIFAIMFFCITIVIYVNLLKVDKHNEIDKCTENENQRIYIEGTTVDVLMSTVSSKSASVLIQERNEFANWEHKYKLQRKVSNSWRDLEIISQLEEIYYNMEVYQFQYDPISIFEIDWSNIYGNLTDGIYRIVQYDDTNKEFYSNEFEIPKENVDKPKLEDEKYIARYNNVTIDALVNTATPTGIRHINY